MARNSIREIEDPINTKGLKLSPEEWTGLGFAYLEANELDKSKASLLEAVHGNPSLFEANLLLAAVNQIEASESLVKGDLTRTRELLKAAEQYGEAARHGHQANISIGDQLGNVYKQLAQADLARNDRASANDELEQAKAMFQESLGVRPDDANAHNGLGVVYYLQGDLEKGIEEQEKAVRSVPEDTYAWYDLALILVDKYARDKPSDKAATVRQLNLAVDKVFELQQTPGAPPLPPKHLKDLEETRAWARTLAAKSSTTAPSGIQFNLSGAGSPRQAKSIQDAIVRYDKYLRDLGFSVPGGSVRILITAANNQYISYYDPGSETIYVNVQYADSTFWPLRDYTFRALSSGLTRQMSPSLVAIMSGLATYYPSSSVNNPDYGPGFGGQLNKFRSLDNLHLENAGQDGSSIWGSICWELRSLLDRDATDALLLKAWGQIRSEDSKSPEPVRFASSIIDLHKSSGGSREEAIRQMFQRRGLKL
jgi:tetratricopeptide (TPR) repeat protein